MKIAVVDKRIYAEEERLLTLHGFHTVTLPPSSKLSEPIASHTDMLVARLGDTIISTGEYLEEAETAFTELYDYAKHLKFSFSSDSMKAEYPYDAILNVLIMGRKMFAKADTASPFLLKKAAELGLEIIKVKQGYPACTTLKLSDTAAITADEGMRRVLEKEGIRVYKIENGGISLPPYEYGFIGGCGGASSGKLFFFGDPSTHPSYGIISEAAKKEGLKIIPLSSGVLRDLGGILFID